MKHEDGLEPLPEALARVLDEERGTKLAPEGSRARVLARLEASLAPAGAAGAPSAASAPASAWWLPVATLLVGLTLGAFWSPRGRTVRVEVPVVMPAPSDAVVAPVPVASLAPSAAPIASAPPASPPRASAPATAAPAAPSSSDERVLLEAARTALLRGDGPATLRMLEQHAARHPDGALREEREALAVQALALAGRREEAAARARAFEVRYPKSLLLPSVRAAVTSAEGPR